MRTAAMTMRDFSIDFLADYLAAAGESVKTSVGAYRLEETGIHLFEKIDGDYFTILGLPLIPLLDFFRGGGDAQLEQIEAQIRQMLVDDRHTFDTAISRSLGGPTRRWLVKTSARRTRVSTRLSGQ